MNLRTSTQPHILMMARLINELNLAGTHWIALELCNHDTLAFQEAKIFQRDSSYEYSLNYSVLSENINSVRVLFK